MQFKIDLGNPNDSSSVKLSILDQIKSKLRHAIYGRDLSDINFNVEPSESDPQYVVFSFDARKAANQGIHNEFADVNDRTNIRFLDLKAYANVYKRWSKKTHTWYARIPVHPRTRAELGQPAEPHYNTNKPLWRTLSQNSPGGSWIALVHNGNDNMFGLPNRDPKGSPALTSNIVQKLSQQLNVPQDYIHTSEYNNPVLEALSNKQGNPSANPYSDQDIVKEATNLKRTLDRDKQVSKYFSSATNRNAMQSTEQKFLMSNPGLASIKLAVSRGDYYQLSSREQRIASDLNWYTPLETLGPSKDPYTFSIPNRGD